MKRIISILCIIFILSITGCSGPKEPMSQQEAEYHARLYLEREYPGTQFIIKTPTLKESNQWEFALKHNELTGGVGSLIFDSYQLPYIHPCYFFCQIFTKIYIR